MYVPSAFAVDDVPRLHGFMSAHSFATLVTTGDGHPFATHLPLLVEPSVEPLGALVGHVARANPQWREMTCGEVLAVFTGPHAYISPSWYADEERVPTWNYTAVHAYGVPAIHSDRQAKADSQRRLIESLDSAWLPKHDVLSRKYVDMMLEGIVNFSIAVTRLDSRWKLSQNRGRREMELIAAALEKSGDAGARELAALTRKHYVDE